MHLAVGKNNHKLVGVIVLYNAEVDAVDNNGETPLHHAARGGSIDSIKLLLSGITFTGYAKPNFANNLGSTPLHVDVCTLLLEHGGDQSAVDRNGLTPLHMAAMCARLGVCKFLLDRGADQSAVDRNGSTPSLVALEAGFEDVAGLLSLPDEDIMPITDSDQSDPPCLGSATHHEEHPAPSPPTSENDAPSPLQLACLESSLEINAQVLLERGG